MIVLLSINAIVLFSFLEMTGGGVGKDTTSTTPSAHSRGKEETIFFGEKDIFVLISPCFFYSLSLSLLPNLEKELPFCGF